jgi:hypothetical protein
MLTCRAAVFLPSLLAGCYTYAPLATGPAPEMQLSLVLSDVGRVGASATLGSGLDRVDGILMGTTDTTYAMRVFGVRDIRGVQTKWSGEAVILQRAWVANAYERHFSRGRTYLMTGIVTSAVAALIATRGFGIVGPTLQNPPGGGGGNSQ